MKFVSRLFWVAVAHVGENVVAVVLLPADWKVLVLQYSPIDSPAPFPSPSRGPFAAVYPHFMF